MTEDYYDVYDGSRLFQRLADMTGMPIDLVNFVVAQISALCLARLFRKSLRSAPTDFRHSLCLVLGLLMGYFCFGKQAIHLAMLPTISYIVLRTMRTDILGNMVLAVSMMYLSCLHLHRQMYHSGDYSLDITGPLMVITQRVTSLAYSVHDGLASEEAKKREGSTSTDMTPAFKSPTPLEFFAYTLAFQTLMCGPVVFYADYIAFIHGAPQTPDSKVSRCEQPMVLEPSPRRAVAYKLAGSLAAALFYLTFIKTYSLKQLTDLMDPSSEMSRTWSPARVLWFAYAATLVVRCKYYHAWLLADAICNNSGMGFNGYDSSGTARWDKLSNIDIIGFELAQNFRSAVASWNKNTNVWLRAVAYERGGAAWRTARVYALSAVWHGFYPGYYLTFMAGGLFTVAARKVRGAVRPLCLGGRPAKLLYDLLTFATTRLAMTYATVPFVLLHLGPSLAFYGKFYYSLHFIALGAILIPSKSARHAVTLNPDLPATTIEVNGETKLHRNGNNTNGKVKHS